MGYYQDLLKRILPIFEKNGISVNDPASELKQKAYKEAISEYQAVNHDSIAKATGTKVSHWSKLFSRKYKKHDYE